MKAGLHQKSPLSLMVEDRRNFPCILIESVIGGRMVMWTVSGDRRLET